MPTILFFGDSLTAGYGLTNPSRESFPALIGEKIKAMGGTYEIVNAGLSGDTTQGGLTRLDYWLSRSVDVFVLELGINDIMRGVPPALIHKNLEMIVQKVKSKYPKVKIALMGMEVPPIISAKVIEEFRSLYPRLAAQHSLAIMPSFLKGVLGVWSLNLGDGIHPSAEGYKVITNNAWPVIRPLLLQ